MLRHQATASLLSRRDVIVVASVSCIYGIGSPEDYAGLAPNVDKKVPLERDEFIHALIDIQYDRNDYDLSRERSACVVMWSMCIHLCRASVAIRVLWR